jgi:hypothetical protein
MSDFTDEQLAAVTKLSGPDRYSFFVQHVTECEELWTLRNAEGFILYTDDDRCELVPVWPDRRLAEACARSSWDECEPFRIDLDRWLAAWLPGLETEGRRVAVFPLPSDQGVVVGPDQLARDLSHE